MNQSQSAVRTLELFEGWVLLGPIDTIETNVKVTRSAWSEPIATIFTLITWDISLLLSAGVMNQSQSAVRTLELFEGWVLLGPIYTIETDVKVTRSAWPEPIATIVALIACDVSLELSAGVVNQSQSAVRTLELFESRILLGVIDTVETNVVITGSAWLEPIATIITHITWDVCLELSVGV